MTAEERNDLAQIAEQVSRIDGRMERVEVALLGDAQMGNAGLVVRVQQLETDVRALLPLARLFGAAWRHWPALVVGAFFFATGGDPAALGQLIMEMVR